jgi:hypothetical protein
VAFRTEGINVRLRAFSRSTLLAISWTNLLVPAGRAQDTPLARGIKHFDKGDYAQAGVALEQGVAAGDAACMDFLGFLYLEGYGNRPDPGLLSAISGRPPS